jgi:putative Holliday junction resolvase
MSDLDSPGTRVMALDFGDKRIGVAFSDPTRTIASPHGHLANDGWKNLLPRLKALATERGAGLVLVGLPLNMDGSQGESARKARDFAARVERALGLPVELVDERLTSVMADEVRLATNPRRKWKDKGERDAVAAAVLLQGWLDGRQ